MSKAARHSGREGSVIESFKPPVLPRTACGLGHSTVCVDDLVKRLKKMWLRMYPSDHCSRGWETPLEMLSV